MEQRAGIRKGLGLVLVPQKVPSHKGMLKGGVPLNFPNPFLSVCFITH